MIKTAGVVFDLYDDDGALLKQTFEGGAAPEVISEGVFLTEEERAALPDNAFAAVITNGEETLRKYACIDAGNTASSTIYFLAVRDRFPSHAKMKIAKNLVDANRYFGFIPPVALVKEAAGRRLIKNDGAEILSNRGMKKRSYLSGTKLMPITQDIEKTSAASVIPDPYVDISTSDVSTPSKSDPVPDELYALIDDTGNRQFPLVSWSQVKLASDFFSEQGSRLHPRTRRQFCIKLASRADELGVDVDDAVLQYGSTTYGPDGQLKRAYEMRRQLWRDGHDEAISLLDALMEKRASIQPDAFAESLAQLDIHVGSDRYWDRWVPDPWASTFGIQKEARWRWVHGTEVLTEDQLERFVVSSKAFLHENFGDDLAEGLAKNPTVVFDSLPLPQKRVIARLAQQIEDGGGSGRMNLS